MEDKMDICGMREMTNKCNVLVGMFEGKRYVLKLDVNVRITDDIKMDARETECESVIWIYLVPDKDLWRAVSHTVKHLP
jgi:hypothetical protein